MEMTSSLFRKDVLKPRSVSARCWDARGGKTRPRPVPGSPLLEHTLCYTSCPPPPYTQHTSWLTNPCHSTQTDLHIYRNPSHTHTQTHTNTGLTLHIPPYTHTYHTDISAHVTMIACTTCSQTHKHPETHADAHGHSPPPYRQPHITYALRWGHSS